MTRKDRLGSIMKRTAGVFSVLMAASQVLAAEFEVPGNFSVAGNAVFKSAVTITGNMGISGDVGIGSGATESCTPANAGTLRWSGGHQPQRLRFRQQGCMVQRLKLVRPDGNFRLGPLPCEHMGAVGLMTQLGFL